jgi:hypothetical protein
MPVISAILFSGNENVQNWHFQKCNINFCYWWWRFPNMGIEVVMLKAWPTSSITHISQSMYSKFWYIHKLDSNQILYIDTGPNIPHARCTHCTRGILTTHKVYSLWGRVEKMLFRPISEKQNSLSLKFEEFLII